MEDTGKAVSRVCRGRTTRAQVLLAQALGSLPQGDFAWLCTQRPNLSERPLWAGSFASNAT